MKERTYSFIESYFEWLKYPATLLAEKHFNRSNQKELSINLINFLKKKPIIKLETIKIFILKRQI